MKKLVLAVLALSVPALIVACGGDSKPAENPPAASATAEASAAPSAAPEASAAATAAP
jgi:hypothetical protein